MLDFRRCREVGEGISRVWEGLGGISIFDLRFSKVWGSGEGSFVGCGKGSAEFRRIGGGAELGGVSQFRFFW